MAGGDSSTSSAVDRNWWARSRARHGGRPAASPEVRTPTSANTGHVKKPTAKDDRSDAGAFEREMADVVRLPPDPRGRVRATPVISSPPHRTVPPDRGSDPGESVEAFAAPGVDRRELRKLKRGDHIAGDRRDLHGLTAAEACAAVKQFIDQQPSATPSLRRPSSTDADCTRKAMCRSSRRGSENASGRIPPCSPMPTRLGPMADRALSTCCCASNKRAVLRSLSATSRGSLPQPGARRFEVGTRRRHQPPELRRVIHPLQMHQLVDHHVVAD